ncbi:MAG TPA: glycerol-3-phosphate dehydrogenase [Ktedonobacter sp.]|nr:glycerol-3-phosphate dehydrogenase [Ktedonobacter sp.]
MATISILGSGIMGTALSFPLADNGHEVRLVGTHLDRDIIDSIQKTGVHPGLGRKVPETVRAYQIEEAKAAFEGAEVALSGVNSFGVHWAGKQLASLLKPGMMVLSIAKGMEAAENGDLHILPEVLAAEVSPDLRKQVSWSAVAGPSIAGEVAARRHDTCVVFTGEDADALKKLAALFRTDYYHVWTSTDVIGVEGCAALKNCYALGVGFAEGILDREGESESKDRNYNYAAALFGQGAVELRQMMRVLGGRAETPFGLAGVGDMYVTSQGGRNVRAGRLVGRGLRFSEVRKHMPGVTLEGAAAIVVIGDALPKLTERGIIKPEDFPLLRHLHAVVAKDELLNMPWDTFFGAQARS